MSEYKDSVYEYLKENHEYLKENHLEILTISKDPNNEIMVKISPLQEHFHSACNSLQTTLMMQSPYYKGKKERVKVYVTNGVQHELLVLNPNKNDPNR